MRYALVIGNSKYDDPKLAQLKTPESDTRELAKVLRSKSIGNFDAVTVLVDQTEARTRRAISAFLSSKKTDDLVLLYFSGHGVLDGRGNLFLASKDTEYGSLNATAISSSFLSYEMDICRSRKQILILDCCNSGAFARAAKGPQRVVTESTFEGSGSGRVVLTASDSTQFAFEGDRIIPQTEFSLFTHFLLEGLKTGQADRDNDGQISLDEWYDYCHSRITATTPQQIPHKWSYRQQGDLIIARNPSAKKKAQPKRLQLRAMLDQKQKDFQQHRLLMDSAELEVVADELGRTKLELQDEDKRLILLSAVVYDDGQKWLGVCGANGVEWLRQAYQDSGCPGRAQVGAVRCLGEIGDTQTYDWLLGMLQNNVQAVRRAKLLDLLAQYLSRSSQYHHLPRAIYRSVFARLARLKIGEGAKERMMMRTASALASSISVVILFTAQFINEKSTVDLNSLISMVLFAVLGAIMAYSFAEVVTSLVLLQRSTPRLWQNLILVAASSVLGIGLFFAVMWDSELWFTGAIFGPIVAMFQLYFARMRGTLPIVLAFVIAISAFIFVRHMSITLSLSSEPALSASVLAGAYSYISMVSQKMTR